MGKTIGSNFNITPPDVGISSSKRHKTTKHLGFAALAATCASLAAFSSGVYADTVGFSSQEVGGRLAPNSVTVSTDGNVSIDIVRNANPTLAVGKGTVTVIAGSGGYQLYISGTNTGSNGYTSLYYDGDINSSSKIEGFNVDTPTAFSSAHTNQWGYAVASEIAAETGFSTASAYNSILSTGATVDTPTINNLKWKGINNNYKLIHTTNSAVSNSTTDIYYGIYTNSADLMAGNYKNSVVYTAFVDGANTLNITPFAIDNGGTMTITAEYQSSEFPVPDASRISVKLRNDTTEIGTCDNITIVDHGNSNLLKFTCRANITDATASSKVLDASVTVKMPNSNSELSYTAEDSWSYYASLDGKTTMQEAATTNACANVDKYSVTGITYSLQDARDSKWYLVRKLEDDNCWMIQNLALEGGTTIHASDSNITEDYTLPTSQTAGFDDNAKQFMYNGKDNGAAHIDSAPDNTSNNTGAYYSWLTATAGSNSSSGSVSTSICPKGWRLPLQDTELKAVVDAVGNTVWQGAPVGHREDDLLGGSGVGLWWSSETVDNDVARGVRWDGSSFISNDYYKRRGFSVRCVLSEN